MVKALAELSVLLLISCAVASYFFWSMGKAWFWRRAIRRFEESDRIQPPKPCVIVFTGSSSINFWKSLPQDMAPLK